MNPRIPARSPARPVVPSPSVCCFGGGRVGEPWFSARCVDRVGVARSSTGRAVEVAAMLGGCLVLLLFLLRVVVLGDLDGEQLGFGAPGSSGSGSFSSLCVGGEALSSPVRVGDFVLQFHLRCVVVSSSGATELGRWCVGGGARARCGLEEGNE